MLNKLKLVANMGKSKEKGNKKGTNTIKTGKEEVGVNCIKILPEEVWRVILSKLEGDVDALLKCRLICLELKVLAEQELADVFARKFKTGAHYLYGGEAEPQRDEEYIRTLDINLFVLYKRGTHFTKLEDVQNFITASKNVTFGNHFPNGCVVFYPDEGISKNQDKLLKFYDTFKPLVDAFSDDISSLVYQFHYTLSPTQFLLQLSLIFKLKNLKQLLIYYSHEQSHPHVYELENLNKLFQEIGMKIPVTNSLLNLQLREFPCNNDKMPLFIVLKNFLPDWKDLEYLSFNWNSHMDMNEMVVQIMRHPPPQKLKSLDLQDPSSKLLEYFCQDSVDCCKDGSQVQVTKISPKLRRIDIRFNKESANSQALAPSPQGYSKEESKLIELFKILDVSQANYLEMLSLDLYIPPAFQPYKEPLPLNPEVKFTKLTHLCFNYITLLRWKSLFEVLKEKFPNIEIITLEHSYDCMQILSESDVKIVGVYPLVSSLWKVFPSLKTILMLYYQWTLKRGGEIPDNVMLAAELL